MTVKTEAKKSATEPSLFDVFGPCVSEQVKATNQRAAELSMDDMAMVIKKSGYVMKESIHTIGHTIGSFVPGNFYQKDVISPRQHILYGVTARPTIRGSVQTAKLSERYEKALGHGPLFPTHLMMDTERCVKRSNDLLERVQESFENLWKLGVDPRTITISIKYSEPETDLLRTMTVNEPFESLKRHAGNKRRSPHIMMAKLNRGQ